MNHLGQLVGENFLGLVELGVRPCVHLIDLLQRQEGQHPDALHHVGVAHVPPVLVEFKGRGLVGVQPDSVSGGLAHLVALGVRQQRDGHAVSVLAQLLADQLGAAQHVAPLVVAAELHIAAKMLEQVVEVVGLHDHVVEFQEGQSPLHALAVAVRPEHVVDGEARANFPQQLHVVQVQQPVGVVDHLRLALAKLDEALHLLFEALGVVVDVLLGEHLPHIGTAGGVADHGRAAADQGDGLVARHLQTLHQGQRHEVAGGQAVGGAVKADVEGGLAVVDHFPNLFLVGDLGNQSPGNQFVIQFHIFHFSFLIALRRR